MAPTPKSPHPFSLAITLVSFAIILLYLLLRHIFEDPPFPTPDWLVTIHPFLCIPAAVTIFAGIRTISASLTRVPRHVPGNFFIALIILAAPIIVIFSKPLPRDSRTIPARIAFNLRGIVHSCVVYSSDNSEHFPPDLVLIGLDGPGATTQRTVPENPKMPTFVYTSADLTNTLDPTLIVAYTQASPILPHGRIVAFADAHAYYFPDAELPAIFAASNAARTKLQLPPISLDGPPPQPPK